ncbi:hypothetical protein AXF42_Ash018313 [Apostasia shenzhenica]|uniref:rRNA methylase YtqB n=1 Tax=Apostasia shenzhenica TaxID=1088818 RepID=A0A2H9ZR48_9ASPA|nr:hypothetical protein AXF42_Ash018313 [Apostasia shenzhenica]
MLSSAPVRPFYLLPKFLGETLCFPPSARKNSRTLCPTCSSLFTGNSTVLRFPATTDGRTRAAVGGDECSSLEFKGMPFPISGSEDALMGFIAGKRKATELKTFLNLLKKGASTPQVASTPSMQVSPTMYSVWKNFIRGGDVVVDATCGNGYDTLAMLKLIADESGSGSVYGLDIQKSALENAAWLLRQYVNESERKLVELSLLCHSRMEEIVPKKTPVRLIAFNLGYLPGGDKTIITKPHTTLLALQAASRILRSEGLMSIVVYVGHPGGREELETVLSFSSSLPDESWVSFKFESVSRSNGPVLVFIFKK